MSKQRMTFSGVAAPSPASWPVVGGYFLPPGGDLTLEGAEDEPDVTISVRIENGEPYLHEIRLLAHNARSQITNADLKSITRQNAQDWVRWIMANLPAHAINEDGSLGEPLERTESYNKVRSAVGRSRKRAHLSEVAQVYRDGGRKGAKAVAEHFGIHTRTAQLWINQARDAGLLGPAMTGKAGEAS